MNESNAPTPDNSTYLPDSNLGVSLVEQQVTDTAPAVAGRSVAISRRAIGHLNEDSWTLSNMLERQNLVDSLTWESTQSANIISEL